MSWPKMEFSYTLDVGHVGTIEPGGLVATFGSRGNDRLAYLTGNDIREYEAGIWRMWPQKLPLMLTRVPDNFEYKRRMNVESISADPLTFLPKLDFALQVDNSFCRLSPDVKKLSKLDEDGELTEKNFKSVFP